MGTSGNNDCQCASRSVLKDFTEGVLTFSAGSPNSEGELATARTIPLLVELGGVAA